MLCSHFLTAFIAAQWLHEPLAFRQRAGVALGLGGVAPVICHKIDIHAVTATSLAAVLIALAAITAGTLYQKRVCPTADQYSAAVLQFSIALVVLAPLAFIVEGARVQWSWQLLAAIAFLVVFASILAVDALHTLMRHGEAARVTSLIYITPIFVAVLEFLMFDVMPTSSSVVGIGITCAGVALVAWRRGSA